MSNRYQHIDTLGLEELLRVERSNLSHLTVQASKFGDLYLPLHLKHQIEEIEGKIDEINIELSHRSSKKPIIQSTNTTNNKKYIAPSKEIQSSKPEAVPQIKDDPVIINNVSFIDSFWGSVFLVLFYAFIATTGIHVLRPVDTP